MESGSVVDSGMELPLREEPKAPLLDLILVTSFLMLAGYPLIRAALALAIHFQLWAPPPYLSYLLHFAFSYTAAFAKFKFYD